MILAAVEMQEQEQGHKLKESWSSWIPDWSRPRLTSVLPLTYAPSLSDAGLFHQNGVLHVAGVAFAEIGTLCTFDPPGCVSHISDPSYEDLKNYLFKVIEHFYPGKVLGCAEYRSLCRAILTGGFADRFVPQRSHSRITQTNAEKFLQDLVDSRMTGAPSSEPWWEAMTDTERLFWDNIGPLLDRSIGVPNRKRRAWPSTPRSTRQRHCSRLPWLPVSSNTPSNRLSISNSRRGVL